MTGWIALPCAIGAIACLIAARRHLRRQRIIERAQADAYATLTADKLRAK